MICVILQKSESLLTELEDILYGISPVIEVHSFYKVADAQRYMANEACDMLIVDPHYDTFNGLDLIRNWMRFKPALNVIFLTDTTEFMEAGYEMFISDYILQPCTPERLVKSIAHARFPLSPNTPSYVTKFKCFGNFEVTINGDPVDFHYSKTKELLAFLVDRQGAMLSKAEISAVLWEDQKHSSYFKSIRKDLLDTLALKHIDGIIALARGKLGIRPETVDCDYYSWLKNPKWGGEYCGEYMSQYSWSEETNGRLQTMLQQLKNPYDMFKDKVI